MLLIDGYWIKDTDGGVLRVQGPLTEEKGMVAHILPGYAHPVVNTGKTLLSFFAVYIAPAGHDYERARREGFGLRVIGKKWATCIVPSTARKEERNGLQISWQDGA